jgi:hypothetical protein
MTHIMPQTSHAFYKLLVLIVLSCISLSPQAVFPATVAATQAQHVGSERALQQQTRINVSGSDVSGAEGESRVSFLPVSGLAGLGMGWAG